MPLMTMDRWPRQKNKESLVINGTLELMDLVDIYRTFHPKAVEYTFFSSAHRAFSRIDNMLGHKTSLNTFKNTEIIQSIFSDHNDMKLEAKYK